MSVLGRTVPCESVLGCTHESAPLYIRACAPLVRCSRAFPQLTSDPLAQSCQVSHCHHQQQIDISLGPGHLWAFLRVLEHASPCNSWHQCFLWLTNDTSSKSYHVKDTKQHQKIKKMLSPKMTTKNV